MTEGQPSRAMGAALQSDVLLRLRRVEGQVRGVQRMVEEQRECREIVTQLAAIKAAVASLNQLVAESYARDCLCSATHIDTADVARLLDLLKTAR